MRSNKISTQLLLSDPKRTHCDKIYKQYFKVDSAVM